MVLTAIVEATGSIAFQLSLNPITHILARMPWLCDAMYSAPLHNSAGYDALVAWLAQPDAKALPLVRMALEEADARTMALLATKRAAPRRVNR